MRLSRGWSMVAAGALYGFCIGSLGCDYVRGKPGLDSKVPRPTEVLAFSTLYRQNCSACHGDSGNNGAAISLANPVYLEVVGEDRFRELVAHGVPGGLMPAFAKSAGGTLTDQQVAALAQGIFHGWSKPDVLAGQNPPPYAATAPGDATSGQQAFAASCARCHGATGEGGQVEINGSPRKLGSIVDPSYLALLSDQNLRSVMIAGRPDVGMPDWRSDGAQPLTDQQVTDIVAWLTSKRVANPGQPYLPHQ